MHNNFIKKTLVLAVASGLSGAINTAQAATARVEEVIVTAQKHEENIQTVPLAISALTAENLQDRGITSYEGVAKASPSISFTPYPSSSNLLILYMRGQGVADANQITADGSVGLYEDGFYISRPQASTFDLADVERVEVLRGPQGTLYGRNTTGGAVNIISKQPTGEFGFKQDLTFGTRDQFRSLTTVNLPKFHDIATKFTLLKTSKDGYVRNLGSGHDYGEEKQQAGRFALHWSGSDVFSVDYFMEKGNMDSTPIWYQNAAWSGGVIGIPHDYNYGGVWPYYGDGGTPHSKTYRPIDLDLSKSDFEGHGLTLAWDLNDNVTLKSLTGYRKLNWNTYADYGNVFSAAIPGVGTLPIVARAYDEVHSHQFSEEFQLIGSALDSRINYVAGLYYFREGASHLQNGDNSAGIPTGAPSPFDVYEAFRFQSSRYVTTDAKSQAIYGQLTWAPPILDDALEFTLGGRYTKDDRKASRDFDNGNSFSPEVEIDARNNLSYKRFNPSFTANYAWNNDLSTYLKWSTGYKAGGSSEAGVPPYGNFKQTVKPEKVVTYEAGLKSYWLDHKVRANVAVFESKFDDMQLNITVNPNDPSVISAFNAGKATVKGAELELMIAPIEDLNLSLNYAWLDADFDKVTAVAGTIYDNAFNPASPYQAGADIKNLFAMPYAPKHTVNLGADYKFFTFDKGNLSAHLDYRYQSKIFTTASTGVDVPGRDYFSIPGYGVLNGRLTLALDLPRGDRARISLWGRNIAHKRYQQHATGIGSNIATISQQDNSVVPAGFTSAAIAWNEPAAYGVDLSYEY